MSAIASFYVVASERLSDIVAAARPMRRRWFRPDNFPEVLHEAGRELEAFAWSGWAFNLLDLYLEARHGFTYSGFGDAAMSRQLSQARGDDWLVLPAPSAAELRAALAPIAYDARDVMAFVAGEHGPDQAAEEAAAVEAALAMLKAWLVEVAPGSVGLLSIG